LFHCFFLQLFTYCCCNHIFFHCFSIWDCTFLQSLATQVCNHIPNNQVRFSFFATTHNYCLQSHTKHSCNHTLVQFLFVPFAVTEINQQFL
jgi:hypothetical protein